LSGVLLPDGQTGLLHTPLCKGLDLIPRKQAEIISRHPTLSAALVRVQIPTAGGPQQVNVLLSWGIPIWLGGIRLGGRSPLYRRRVEILQREVNTALARRFRDKLAELGINPSLANLPPGAPATMPSPRRTPHPRRPMRTQTSHQQSSAVPQKTFTEEQLDERIRAAVQAAVQEIRQEQQARDARFEARLDQQAAALAALQAEVVRLAARESASQASAGPAQPPSVTWADLEEVIEAVGELGVALDRVNEAVQRVQQATAGPVAQMQWELAEVQRELTQVRQRLGALGHQLAQVVRALVPLTAEPLASRAQVVMTEGLMKAVIAQLQELHERVSRLEPTPPPPMPPRRGGRPRKDRRP